MMESNNVEEQLSRNFTFVAADSAIGNGPGGLARSPDSSSKIQPPALLAKRG